MLKMESFYILYFVLFAIAIGISIYLINYVRKEYSLYKLFSGDKLKMRALLAKDAKRFHMSIVYLMTYLTRSNGIHKVQKDKLRLIIRYIVEVMPLEYQLDAVKVLKYLTDREKKSGKNTYDESIVDVDAFKEGKYKTCIKDGDSSYHYSHDIHGERIAEELSYYLSEDDRLYVMFLLYRLAILDGIITTDGSDSELNMLNNLCVDGLKIDSKDLDGLIESFENGTDQSWYDQHFVNKNGQYPSSNLLANIFRVDLDELANLKHRIIHTSFLEPIQITVYVTLAIVGILYIIFNIFNSDVMTRIYPAGFFYVGMGLVAVMTFANIFVKPLDSAKLFLLRTGIEDSLQRTGLILTSVLSGLSIILLFLIVPNFLLVLGNEKFGKEEDVYHVTVPVNSTYSTRHKNSTSYHVRFPEVNFSDKGIQDGTENEDGISSINSFCLNTLPSLSGMNLLGVTNFPSMTTRSISYDEYLNANGKYIRLNFKVGYFGMVYHSSYQITDFNDEDDVIEDQGSVIAAEDPDF